MNLQRNNNKSKTNNSSSMVQQLHEKMTLAATTTKLELEEETQSETDVSTTSSEQSEDPSKVSNNAATTTKDTVVNFGSVQIREFDRIVGDHPDVGLGPPLSIGWKYLEKEAVDLDTYEQQKQNEQDQKIQDAKNRGGWAPLPGLRKLSSGKRRDILRIDFDISQLEIEKAEAEVEKTKKQREQTNKQKKVFMRTEEIFQSAQRKLKRTFSRDLPEYQAFPKRLEVVSAPPAAAAAAAAAAPTKEPPISPSPHVAVTIRKGVNSSTITQISVMPQPLRMREISV